jgi:hypothetical protein
MAAHLGYMTNPTISGSVRGWHILIFQ